MIFKLTRICYLFIYPICYLPQDGCNDIQRSRTSREQALECSTVILSLTRAANRKGKSLQAKVASEVNAIRLPTEGVEMGASPNRHGLLLTDPAEWKLLHIASEPLRFNKCSYHEIRSP